MTSQRLAETAAIANALLRLRLAGLVLADLTSLTEGVVVKHEAAAGLSRCVVRGLRMIAMVAAAPHNPGNPWIRPRPTHGPAPNRRP